MKNLMKFLSGKKTYVTAIFAAVIAGLEVFDIVVPTYVWPILGALGLGFLRAGIEKNK